MSTTETTTQNPHNDPALRKRFDTACYTLKITDKTLQNELAQKIAINYATAPTVGEAVAGGLNNMPRAAAFKFYLKIAAAASFGTLATAGLIGTGLAVAARSSAKSDDPFASTESVEASGRPSPLRATK